MKDDSLINVGKDPESQERMYPVMSYNMIWNAAIEAAANMLASSYPDNVSTNAFCAAVRSMKK